VKRWPLSLAASLALASLGGLCTPAEVQRSRDQWDAEHERVLAHIPREQRRVMRQSYHGETLRIWLERDATVAGVPCHGEVELRAGKLAEATLSAPHREGRLELPKGSRVFWGHPGGALGLARIELGADTLIDGVACAARDSHGQTVEARFDESGALLWCTLAAPLPQNPDCVRGAMATISAEGVTCSQR